MTTLPTILIVILAILIFGLGICLGSVAVLFGWVKELTHEASQLDELIKENEERLNFYKIAKKDYSNFLEEHPEYKENK